MCCTEMKELQIRCDRYAERRGKMVTPATERRVVPTGHRNVQARIAYLMIAHRQNCTLCGAEN
jgi:hypothetical protein